MAKKTSKGRHTPPKRTSPENAELVELFAEAKLRKTERDGIKMTVAERTFILWPSQIEYNDRIRLARHTQFTPNDLGAMLITGDMGTLEAFAAFCAMSIFQQDNKTLADLDGIQAWLEEQIFERGEVPEVEVLKFHIADVDDEDGEVLVIEGESDEDAGPEH